jgi:hypothetical protein
MSIAPRGWSRSDHRRGTDHAGNIRGGRKLRALVRVAGDFATAEELVQDAG